MKNLQAIATLMFICCFLTMFLFGFTVYHKNKLLVPTPPETFFACGTPAYGGDDRSISMIASASAGEMIFNANCKACHRLNQKLVGPALKGVFDRRDSVWIRTLITNIDILIKRRDKQVQQLRKEYNYLEHTRFESMPKEDMDNLLIFLKDAGNPVY